MKAIRIHDYGDADILRYENAPLPEIGPTEVLVKVHAASINPVDWKIRGGHFREYMPLTFPVDLSYDMSGAVERVGAAVGRFRPGDPVIARTSATYAEYALAKADEVAPAPKSITLARAVGIPIAGTAA